MDSTSDSEGMYQHQLLLSAPEDDTEDSRDGEDEKPVGVIREQDRFLPIANVARLMKSSIPKTGKIAKETRECVQECVSEFISFITSEASDRCHQEKRKTINGEDILFAMQALGFDNYVEPLKLYLQKYREANKGDKAMLGSDGGEGEAASATSSFVDESGEDGGTAVTAAQGGTVLYAYDLGQVQPTTSAGNNGANFNVG